MQHWPEINFKLKHICLWLGALQTPGVPTLPVAPPLTTSPCMPTTGKTQKHNFDILIIIENQMLAI
jgi:hypothetical protein